MKSPIAVESLRESSGSFGDVLGLPPSVYSDPEFHHFELEAVFASEWLCVGRAEQISEVGDFIATSRAGEPLIVVRSTTSEIHAMSAVCRHRGMCVTADLDRSDDDLLGPTRFKSGTVRNFRCPYHWWVYGLDGRLLGAPEMDRTANFDPGSIRLPQLPVEVWQGFVFVNLDSEADPLGPSLHKLDQVLRNYHLDELATVDPLVIPDVPFNWKIMIENFMEMYHNSRLHKGIHDWAPSSGAWYSDFSSDDGGIFGFNRSLEPGGGFNPTFRALFPLLPDTTEEERQRVVFALVPPSLQIGIQSDSAFRFCVDPTGPTTHDLSMGYLFPRSTLDLPMFDELLASAIQGVGHFNRQDLPTNVATQRGKLSRFAPRAHFSWQEEALAQFSSWLVDRYEKLDGAC